MATATSSATMAAAGHDSKRTSSSTASSLQTPGSGTFPSELLTPMTTASPSFMRKDEALRTPITPPSAYLEFLKNFSPAIQSPASATSTRFSFNDKGWDRSFGKVTEKSSISPPTSQPSISRNNSSDSNVTQQSAATTSSAAAENSSRPDSPRINIPASPFVRPAPRTARTPRRLNIPQSPFSPALGSAHSLQSQPSPYTSTPLSAAPWSASFSPREYNPDINGPPGSKLHVRHVVTRTVTYCRTPLDPAPKGKRRKIEGDDDVTSSKASSEEPPIKQECSGRIDELSEESAAEDSIASASASEHDQSLCIQLHETRSNFDSPEPNSG
ncbi:hypothetical protein AC578_996 [Pseudocercospora eumusae]|uniref:Uncharacterized protein n=1 Tax=Pseudocercospora eumusae TaxID=321146 RepID=A0A139GU64_9PEZI|nr:hypothetical protein AC578_996 [Pseudocercospora eumusae]